ncbi:hypothetical protein [Pedobacter sp. Leaf194]|uniref:hypothetical protein n=1 Tax=Pedobacter sp. Leaf194 TaxID=1736297 RepID=UPI0012F757C5|nr:hypothetical protein [Pedobacter sp. Leaf194]
MENDLKYIFFIKAPMQGVAFKLDKADLIDGMGIWQAQFSSCRIFNLRPSSGTVRGARVITDDHSTVERWVVEVKIVLSDGGGIEKKLDVKQIFYPDSYNSDPYKEYRCKMIPR